MIAKLNSLLLLLTLTACTWHNNSITPTTPSDLNLWVDNQLIPYVVKHVSRHPKFKGQPVALVSLKGNHVTAEVNGLAHDIRNRMTQALLQTPGVRLVWRPTLILGSHDRGQEYVSCDELRGVRYYIGLDVGLSPKDGAVEVTLRTLDLTENTWVSGFYLSWRGKASSSQQYALSRRYKDESLRGLRLLPFTSSQPDLLASFLAHNVGCLLNNQKIIDQVVIYTDDGISRGASFFRTAFILVDNYLTHFRDIRLTNDPTQANITLYPEVHFIHKNLFQVWLTVRNQGDDRSFSSAKIDAYVRSDESFGAEDPNRGGHKLLESTSRTSLRQPEPNPNPLMFPSSPVALRLSGRSISNRQSDPQRQITDRCLPVVPHWQKHHYRNIKTIDSDTFIKIGSYRNSGTLRANVCR